MLLPMSSVTSCIPLGTLLSIDSVLHLLSVQHSYLQASFILLRRKNVANDLSKSNHMFKLTIKRCKDG